MVPDQIKQYDVLIQGGGPVGLFAALNCLHAGLSVRIVDIEYEPNHWGRGDWLHPRTLEILEQFGLIDDLLKTGARATKIVNYRQGVMQEHTVPVIKEADTTNYKYILCVGQHITESVLQNAITLKGINVERPLTVSEFHIDDAPNNVYPISATISNMRSGETEQVRSKYLFGCDGGHSDVRKHLGFHFSGETTEMHSGVFDAIIKTNLTTLKDINLLQSSSGSVTITPRENGLSRVFVHFQQDARDPYNRNKIQLEEITKEAKRAMMPFRAEFLAVLWWTVYVVGQRVADHYQYKNRVFLCGDACHSQSPTLGQGLNTGLADVHNLVWKIYMTEKGLSPRSILDTYEIERRPIAEKVISIDKEVAGLAQTGITSDGPSDDLLCAMEKHMYFSTGLGIEYPETVLTPRHTTSTLKLKVQSGERAPDPKVVRYRDHKKIRLLNEILSTTPKFALICLVGELSRNEAILLDFYNHLACKLSRDLTSIHAVTTSTPVVVDASSHIEDLKKYPLYFDKLNDTQCHRVYGVAFERPAVVVVRPDGIVGYVAPLEEWKHIEKYFDSVVPEWK